jgi:hypothetical protein
MDCRHSGTDVTGRSPDGRKTMTDKDDLLRLGAGTVPDPFGLAWDPHRHVPGEETIEPDSTGSTATDTDQDGDATGLGVPDGDPEEGTVRLGELD